jgi:hypothetical protein
MNRTQIALVALLVFLLSATSRAFAQTSESLPYYIEWEQVAGAGGYDFEVVNAAGESAFEKRLEATDTSIELTLPAGKYQFRISTLNKFLRVDSTSEWVSFTVLAYGAPTFEKLTPQTVRPGIPLSLTLQADMLSTKATVTLISPTGKKIPVSIKKAKGKNFALTGAGLTERGSYTLVMTNPPNYTTIRKAAIQVAYPEPTILSVEPAQVSREDLAVPGATLTVRGKNFSPEATLGLQPSRGTAVLWLSPKTLSAMEASATLPETLDADTYAVFLRNATDLAAIPAGTLVVDKKPEVIAAEPPAEPAAEPPVEKTPPAEKTVKHWLCLGVAGGAGLIFGEWKDVYSEPVIAGAIFADFYLSPSLVPESGRGILYSVGLRADYAAMQNDGNGAYVKSDTQTLSVILAPAATYALSRFRFRLRIGGGIDYLRITAKDLATGEKTDKASLDFAAETGLSTEFLPTERIAIGIDNELIVIANQNMLSRYTLSLSTSYAIPIKR